MIDDITLARWEQPHPSLSLTQERLREAIREIRWLREERKEEVFAAHYDAELVGLRDDLAAYRAVVRELAERFANIQRNPGYWEAECRAALAHPLVQQAREEKVITKPVHVCGGWGYGQERGDSCPACDAARERRPHA